MSKHTPGPWVFSAIDSTEGFLVVEKARPKSLVATVCKRNGCGWACPHEEPWANARLIAAAPELLDSCKRLYSLVEMLLREMNDPDRDDTCESDMEHANYVISTAEGDFDWQKTIHSEANRKEVPHA